MIKYSVFILFDFLTPFIGSDRSPRRGNFGSLVKQASQEGCGKGRAQAREHASRQSSKQAGRLASRKESRIASRQASE